MNGIYSLATTRKPTGKNTYRNICVGTARDGKARLLAHVIIFSMSLTLEQVEHIANLARLDLSEEEKALYREQLSAILDYVASLQTLDTDEIPPTAGVLPPLNVLRSDEPIPGLSLEALLRGAPQVEQNQFRIPPVFE